MKYERIPCYCSECGGMDDSCVDDLKHEILFRIKENYYVCIGCACKLGILEAAELAEEINDRTEV